MRSIRTCLTAAAIGSLLFLVFPAPPSQAATTFGTPALLRLLDVGPCPNGYLCLYQDEGLRGGGYGVREGRDLNDFRGINFNDEMSSWANATSSRYCWYPDINFSGPGRGLQQGAANNVNFREDNDIASSIEDC
ncbi:peptidase inhibitor family I36 protein [Streptomyces sp. NRRL F-2664]|uniref:peptidase inhibitor family I36 protein n=1 Tax=Streptomyces sp. NRRL F-2664 TaxID=1463842 RepID=UPI00099601B0